MGRITEARVQIADTSPVSRRAIALVVAALGVLSLASPAGAERSSSVDRLRRNPAVRASGEASPEAIPPGEHLVRAAGTVPNDPLYGDQWGPAKVGMEEVWADTTGSTSTVIAVVDSGVRADGTYPDLKGKVLPGWDFVDNDSNANDEMDTDVYIGHGTFVALIAAAMGNDGNGMAGYCWQCKILPVRVLDENGVGDTGGVASGIEWAVDHGADVINLSLTGSSSSQALDDAVAYAVAAGVLVVAAAGNEDPDPPAEDLTVPRYPAALPGVVSVAASNPSDGLYSWSYRGPSWVKVAAPGCIFSDDGSDCGTSFASPGVAGILGSGRAVAPCATDDVLTGELYTAADPVAGDPVEHGRVNADAFLDEIETQPATRVAGSTRIATAISVSRRAYVSAPQVVLARSDSFADALAAAPLAAKVGGPVLLTPRSGLDALVADEIERLGATDVWLMGGTAALSPGVVSGLNAEGFSNSKIHRVEGENRYETAAAIGHEVNGDSVFIASASSFADGVAVSSLAAHTQSPILLVQKDAVPQATLNELAFLEPTTVQIIGGTGVISAAVEQQLEAATGLPIDRLDGSDRYATSRAIGEAAQEAGLDPLRLWVATGSNWPDALATGPAAAAAGGVLLLASSDAAMVRDWIGYWGSDSVAVAGGPGTISDATVCAMDDVLTP
jgi:putative cell wall-binding protein